MCLRPDAIPEALATSHTRQVFSGFAQRAGAMTGAIANLTCGSLVD